MHAAKFPMKFVSAPYFSIPPSSLPLSLVYQSSWANSQRLSDSHNLVKFEWNSENG